MAKKTAAQIDAEQSIIPVHFREALRVSEDGTQVFVTFALPRFIQEPIRKSNTIEIDLARAGGASRLSSVFRYGLGREMRDGGTPKESYKDENGDVVDRVFTKTEKLEYAMAHAEMRREWFYGEREKQARGGVDIETVECRGAVAKFCINKMGMTTKSVPSEIARATSVSDVKIAAKQAGVPAKALQELIKRGLAIAEMRNEEIEYELPE